MLASIHRCPDCRATLQRTTVPHGVFWLCPKCDARFVGIGLLRKLVAPAYVAKLLLQKEGKSEGRPCPLCARKMETVVSDRESNGIALEICHPCYSLWFDPGEFEQCPPAAQDEAKPSVGKELPLEARILIAKVQMRRIRDEVNARFEEVPEENWKIAAAIIGLPVTSTPRALRTYPVATWALAAIVSVVSIACFNAREPFFEKFGFVPNDPFRYGGATLITPFFLHAGFFHLLSNLYFWLTFGPDVEEHLGKRGYLSLIAASVVAGHLVVAALTPHVSQPNIGASGGIFGIVAFYMLKFPRRRITIMFAFRFLSVPAAGLFFLLLVNQIMGAFKQIAGFSEVSFLAHLGGAAVGLLFSLVTARHRELDEDEEL